MDLVAPLPVFNLYNYEWPIYTEQRPAAAGQVRAGRGRRHRRGDDSVLSPGVVVTGGTVQQVGALARRCGSGPAPRCRLGADERASGSARARWSATRSSTRTSSSRPGAQIGVDHDADRAAGFLVEDGLTVLGKDQQFQG